MTTNERLAGLAQRVCGPGECPVVVEGDEARVERNGEALCMVTAFDGDPLGALERFLLRQPARS